MHLRTEFPDQLSNYQLLKENIILHTMESVDNIFIESTLILFLNIYEMCTVRMSWETYPFFGLTVV
jgi:hypothetical protein